MSRIHEIEQLLKLNLPVIDRLNPEYAEAIGHLDYLLSLVRDGGEKRVTMRDLALRHTEHGKRATAPTESSERCGESCCGHECRGDEQGCDAVVNEDPLTFCGHRCVFPATELAGEQEAAAAEEIVKAWLWHTEEHDQERARKSIAAIISKHCYGGRETENERIRIIAYLSHDTIYQDDFCVRCSHEPSNCEGHAPVYMAGWEPDENLKALKAKVSRLNSEVERLKEHVKAQDARIVNQRTEIKNRTILETTANKTVAAYWKALGGSNGLTRIQKLKDAATTVRADAIASCVELVKVKAEEFRLRALERDEGYDRDVAESQTRAVIEVTATLEQLKGEGGKDAN